jgi:hypothetical protein
VTGWKHRLERLEGVAARKSGKQASEAGTPYYLQRYFKELANLRRCEAGLEPLPYTPEDLEDDRRCLEETIPIYRASPGWQSEEAQHVLDHWEQHIKDNLEKGASL